ncbi:hypothetical protein B0H34DRAFT_801621 [Crassisporium funariophilum]|nr:hypothetical protein B0H34DRAFT_801621 [Crassisporium funariophilum]
MAIFNTAPSSQDVPPPVGHSYPGQLVENFQDEPAIQDNNNYQGIIQHPNGSEGWLPAENMPVPQQQSDPFNPSSRVVSPTAKLDNYASPGRMASPTRAGIPPDALGASNASVTASTTRRATTGGVFAPKVNGNATSLGRASSRRSAHTTGEGRQITGSAFVNGAGTTGPSATAESDDELHNRGLMAHNNLTPKQKSKIARSEAKDGKRISKIIRQEGKTEKQSLAMAIDELADLQRFQKNAVKSEARVHANHTKLLAAFKKHESAYLNAKMRYETAQAELNADADALETLRNSSREATERVQDKAAEVDSLRATLAVDEREREVKLGQLRGSISKKSNSGSLWR